MIGCEQNRSFTSLMRCLLIQRKQVFYWNRRTDWAGFGLSYTVL